MRFILISIFIFCSSILFCQSQRNIEIDFQKEKGQLNQFFNECIGAGRAHEGLRADWQTQLKETKEECGFRYIRFHGIFHDDMGVYAETEEGQPVYNWQNVDQLYDFLLSIEMKPFVELSFMPEDLASGDKTVFWWKGNVTPPKAYDRYYDLIHQFTQHLTERYGQEEVKSWYFEVWNEANHPLFFDGKLEDYLKMYETAAKAVKAVSADYRIGGPASAGTGWVEELIAYCTKEKVALDFISTHSYGVQGFFDNDGKRYLKLRPDADHIPKNVAKTQQWIEDSGRDLPLHFTEWSSSYSPLDPVHDTYQNATYILHVLKKTEGETNSISYWVFTDIFEELGIPKTPFHGGFGLMNLQGIKKPTYQIYKYLNQLGSTELQNKDTQSWACKENDSVQLLLWDFSLPEQGEDNNKVFFRKDHPAPLNASVRLQIDNLPKGKYALKIYRTGYLNNDVFTAYYQMGLPNQLSITQENYLKEVASDPAETLKVIEITNTNWTYNLDLKDNDVVFLKLEKLQE